MYKPFANSFLPKPFILQRVIHLEGQGFRTYTYVWDFIERTVGKSFDPWCDWIGRIQFEDVRTLQFDEHNTFSEYPILVVCAVRELTMEATLWLCDDPHAVKIATMQKKDGSMSATFAPNLFSRPFAVTLQEREIEELLRYILVNAEEVAPVRLS